MPLVLENPISLSGLWVVVFLWLAGLSWLGYRLARHGRWRSSRSSLEAVEDLEDLVEEVASLREEVRVFKGLSETYVQKLGIVRFNPYNDTGGDQSFAIALLNKKGDGLVLSSLHGRSGTRVYGKPVLGGKAGGYPLSDEERLAIRKAMED